MIGPSSGKACVKSAVSLRHEPATELVPGQPQTSVMLKLHSQKCDVDADIAHLAGLAFTGPLHSSP